jgi:hypothetical protein
MVNVNAALKMRNVDAAPKKMAGHMMQPAMMMLRACTVLALQRWSLNMHGPRRGTIEPC